MTPRPGAPPGPYHQSCATAWMEEGPVTDPSLWSASSFRVSFRYGRQETGVDVVAGGTLVARLVKVGRPDSAQPYRLTVAGQPAGIIGGPVAYGPDGAPLGRVDSRKQVMRGYRWSVDQPGLGTLTASAVGASGLRYAWPQSMVLASGPANAVLPFRFHFRGGGSDGFTVHRKAGMRAEFDVEVHDPRVDRRLAIAAVLALSRYESNDLRQEIADITGNPFE